MEKTLRTAPSEDHDPWAEIEKRFFQQYNLGQAKVDLTWTNNEKSKSGKTFYRVDYGYDQYFRLSVPVFLGLGYEKVREHREHFMCRLQPFYIGDHNARAVKKGDILHYRVDEASDELVEVKVTAIHFPEYIKVQEINESQQEHEIPFPKQETYPRNNYSRVPIDPRLRHVSKWVSLN